MGEALVHLYGEHLRHKIRALPPRVNTDLFRPPQTRKAPDGWLDLAIVGTLTERKGQLRLLQTLEKADIPVRLHIVGEGPDRAELERRLAESRSGQLRVHLHGQVDHASLAKILAGCDALVMYSRHEGTPRAILEAMATGMPVITTDAGFCADIVEHQKEGIVLSTTDTDADLLRQLKHLLHNPSVLRAMGNAALDRARQQFAADKLYPRYRALIAEAAGR
jgi:glycosyltransferase involved in cell wall biosynthesis